MRFVLSIAIVLAAFSPASAQDETAPEIGRIESVAASFAPVISDAYVLHGDGSRVVPITHTVFLHPGDQIYVLVPDIDIGYSLVGSNVVQHVTQTTSPKSISGHRGLTAWVCTLVNCEFVERLREAAWTPTPIYTHSHGINTAPISASHFLPAGEQLLPRSTAKIAVIWFDGIGTASISGEERASSNVGFQLLTVPKARSFAISVTGEDGGTLSWPVRVVDIAPPAPPGFNAHPTDADRLERALYLLQPAPDRAAWRLFAISELAALRETSIVADIAWRQVVSGKYQPE